MNYLRQFFSGRATPRTYFWTAFGFLITACAVSFFYKLGSIGFLGPDEPRYAQVAREMMRRNDWVTPTLLGRNWFEKPILLYWLAGISYRIFGENEWAARIPGSLLGTGCALALFWIGNRVGGLKFGFAAGLMLATSIAFFSFGRAATFDIYLTGATLGAFISFFLTESSNPRTRRMALASFYAFLGLGLLAKGLVGVLLPGGGIALYLPLRHRGWRNWIREALALKPWYGAPIVLLVAGTWYWPVIARNGWPFIQDFFIAHHFQRFTSNRFHHPGPVYYYIPVLILGMLPWTAFFLAGITRALKSALKNIRENSTEINETNRLVLLSLSWFLFPVLFFSFSGSKLPGYILPVIPMAAVLSAAGFSEITGMKQRWFSISTTALQLILVIGLPVLAKTQFKVQPFGLLLILTGVTCLLVGIAFQKAKAARTGFIVATAMLHLLLLVQATVLFPRAEDRESQKPIATLIEQNARLEEPLTFFRCRKYAPVFYNFSRLRCCDDEREPNRFETEEELSGAFRNEPSLIVLCPANQVATLLDSKSLRCQLIDTRDKFAAVRVFNPNVSPK